MAFEREILEALLASAGTRLPPGVTGPGDDGCVVPAELFSGGSLVVTCDALEEGVHFREGWLSLEDLAHKLVAVNVSDAAAMGAEPLGLLVAIAWPSRLDASEARRFGRALAEACEAAGCPLLGGDTDVREAPMRLEGTLLARCETPLLRSGGREGDTLFVSGPLGGAALAVRAWESGTPLSDSEPVQALALAAFRRPRARLDVARALRASAHGAIDLSDGLRADAGRLGLASGLAVRLSRESVPLHGALRSLPSDDALALALDGGEDYELLVAGPPNLPDACAGLARVGELVAGTPGTVTIA